MLVELLDFSIIRLEDTNKQIQQKQYLISLSIVKTQQEVFYASHVIDSRLIRSDGYNTEWRT